MADTTQLARTIRALELMQQSAQAHAAGDLTHCDTLIDQAITDAGADTVVLIRGGMTIGEIPTPDDDGFADAETARDAQ